MNVVWFGLGILAVILGLFPLLMTRRFRRYVEERLCAAAGNYTPKVTFIVPCKGTDLEFERNIEAVLSQEYPRYEVIFVTATRDDPAYGTLERLVTTGERSVSVRLLTAGIKPGRAQKLTNLLKGVECASDTTEVFAFLDADLQIGPEYLRHLVAPLANPAIGATTGSPWYLPLTGRGGSVLRSIWGAGALPILVDPRRNFAAGAANALTRVAFEEGRVGEAMSNTVSDTFAITNAMRRLGRRVEFVPRCLVIAPDDSTGIETLKWTNRQTTISRVYSPTFWWTVAITYSLANAILVLGIILLAASWLTGETAWWRPALLMLAPIPLAMVNAALILPIIIRLLPGHADQLRRLRWKYILLTPLASLLICTNSIVSRTTNVIEWRGVRYRLVSSSRTEVLSADNVPPAG